MFTRELQILRYYFSEYFSHISKYYFGQVQFFSNIFYCTLFLNIYNCLYFYPDGMFIKFMEEKYINFDWLID